MIAGDFAELGGCSCAIWPAVARTCEAMHQSANGVFGLKPDAGSPRECIGYERWVADFDELDRDLAISELVALRPSKLRGKRVLSAPPGPSMVRSRV